jgi:hypothetical protein
MKEIFLCFGIIILVLALLAAYRFISLQIQNRRLNKKRFERIQPLYELLQKGQTPGAAALLPYAQNLLTREMTYKLLQQYGKAELFPASYFSIEKSAESNLANWLESPTELHACPDEMVYLKRVSIEFDHSDSLEHYEVFKFRINEPNPAAKHGWMLGVVGPYSDDSKPYDFPKLTFSRNSRSDKVTPEEEVQWVYDNIALRK